MLRALLTIALLAVVAGVAFYAGRITAPMPPPGPAMTSHQPQTPAQTAPENTPQPSPQPESATRGGSIEPPPSPPEIAGSIPESSPPHPAHDAPHRLVDASAAKPFTGAIGLPIKGLKAREILDTFDQARSAGERRHEAADIMAPRGTPVVAVDSGIVKKLFNSKPGGLTVYQFDSSERFSYYYAHLDRYAEGLREGMLVKRGDLIGYVGSTGNADPAAPHLHFAIFELGPEKNWWQGKPINPYPLLVQALK